MKKLRIIIIIFLVFLAFVAIFFFFWNQMVDLYTKLYLGLPKIELGIGDFLMKEIEKYVSTPPPLKSTEEAPDSFLTVDGVIRLANVKRKEFGLPSLVVSAKLSASAKLKVEDMFNNQYFSHDSPSDIAIGDLAASVGYEFIAIGENLALGNFKNDEALVNAWMNSSGHRENILNPKYKEIGVAVARGTFEGKTTWLAVQHFGTPLAVCSAPDEQIKTEIESDKEKLREIEDKLTNLLDEFGNMKKRDPEYNQKIEEYNNLVSEYNATIGEIKTSIDKYNIQVNKYNTCVTTNQ